MRKFSYLLLTALLSFFVLSLNKAEGYITFDNSPSTPAHNLQNDHSFNAIAISIDNYFERESINFDEHKKQSTVNHFYATALLNESLLNISSLYLKICNFLDLNLTVRSIIYPFHSFL